MQALFLNIPFYKYDRDGQICTGPNAGSRWPFTQPGRGSYAPFPFLMGYAVSYLRHHGVEADFYDGVALKRWDHDAVRRDLAAMKPETVFIDTATPLYPRVAEYGGWLKEELGARVVLIGPHVHTYGEQILREEAWVDHCVIGEYEIPALEIVRQGEGAERLYRFRHLDDLNRLGSENFLPHRPLGLLAEYWDPSMETSRVQLQVNTSRGCPFKCVYCQWPKVMNNGTYRNREPEMVIDEIRSVCRDYSAYERRRVLGRAQEWLASARTQAREQLRRARAGEQGTLRALRRARKAATRNMRAAGVGSIFFDDDTWNLGARRIRALCAGLSELGLPWTMMGRTDVSNEKLYDLMVDSGCVGMRFGVESFDQRLLDNVKKKMDGQKNYDMVKHLITRYSGMEFHFTTMKNLPGESDADWQRDLRKLNELRELGARRDNVIHWQNSDCVAFPGTELWEELTADGKAPQLHDFELFDGGVHNTRKLAEAVGWLGEDYRPSWSEYSGMGQPTSLPEDTPIDEPVARQPVGEDD